VTTDSFGNEFAAGTAYARGAISARRGRLRKLERARRVIERRIAARGPHPSQLLRPRARLAAGGDRSCAADDEVARRSAVRAVRALTLEHWAATRSATTS